MLRRYDMTKTVKPIIGGDGKTSISCSGFVKDENMDNVPSFIGDDGFEYVNIRFLDVVDDYRIIDLMACHFKFLEDVMTFEELKQVNGFFINSTILNKHHASNIGYRFREGKLPCSVNSDYYFVPGYPTRGINKDGEIISSLDGEKRVWGIQQAIPKRNILGGYHTNNVYLKGTRHVMSRHRSLLLVFKGYPDEVDRLASNHIDGVPGNDNLDNLEWVSRSENNNHAFRNGLKTQNKPVLARNTRTGEITEYYSVAECGRQLGILDTTLNGRLEKCRFGYIDKNGYQFKYVNDPREWVDG